MTPETKDKLIKRLKSLAWRLGCAMVVAGLNFLSQQLTTFSLPPEVVGLLGLVLGEVSKFVNNHTNVFGAALK